jgi:hypothetical protein
MFFRLQLEQKHQEAMQNELHQINERHQNEILACKKKQWCNQCEKEGK